MSANLDVLAVGAHPDDVEVHCGGLPALASRRGPKAGVPHLPGGQPGTRATDFLIGHGLVLQVTISLLPG